MNSYKLGLALKLDKPVLVVGASDESLTAFQHAKSKKLVLKEYTRKYDLERVLDEFLVEVGNTLDAKLFMVIPPTVNKYLDWIATHTNKSKSDVVRAAVEDVAGKDKAYQTFLKRYQQPSK